MSYFQNTSVTLNEHQALAINEYELAKLERNQNKEVLQSYNRTADLVFACITDQAEKGSEW